MGKSSSAANKVAVSPDAYRAIVTRAEGIATELRSICELLESLPADEPAMMHVRMADRALEILEGFVDQSGAVVRGLKRRAMIRELGLEEPPPKPSR